jgi:7,8-dihydro-6-hydroxymethylpterin dimethyltransferase
MYDGIARKSAPYLFLGQTTSLCETCLGLVPAKIVEEDGGIYYSKHCPEHGVMKTLVSDDPVYWRRTLEYLKPGDRPLQPHTRTERGCPWDCGLCPDHEQHSCLAIVEINEACNLACPVCFADSSPKRNTQRSLAEVERMFDALVASEGEPDLVQISGGEPTIHPQILEVIAAARRRPIKHVMLNTNGIRIAEDPAFVDALAEFKPGFEVYLQFDSLNDAALKNLRGAALSRIRRQALANLEARGISTTLVCTVKRGVNDAEIGAIVRHALTYKCVRGVNFQPVQDAGRNEGFDPKLNRIVLSEIRRRIVEDSGIFADGDMIPLPCNPASISIGYGVRNGEQVIPLTSLVPREALLPAMPNAISFEKYPELRRRFVDLLSLSTADTNTTERLGSLLCCLPDVPMPEGSGYENVFRVTIVEFLDRFNFCLANVKRSCVHFVTPEGSIIPFDTYNTFYRPGAAGNARLAEARLAEARR